jgi:PAS domain S-box-containing protein
MKSFAPNSKSRSPEPGTIRGDEEIRRENEEIRVAIDTIPGLVWTCLPDGQVDYLNKRWLDYTGLRQEEALGWGWQTAVHPEDLPGLVAYWRSILESGEAGQHEARLRRFDGEYRWFIFQGVPRRDSAGNVVRWYGTNTDIESTRASEQLARGQFEALRQILAGLSTESEPEKFLEHVLRTMTARLGAQGIGAWKFHEQSGQVDFIGSFEADRLRLPGPGDDTTVSPFVEAPGEHAVWSDFARSGSYCVIGEIRPDGVYVRAADGPDTAWHPYHSKAMAHPAVPAMIEKLRIDGVVSTLCVPMFVGGKVTGFLSIRFRQRREFQSYEIELARALAHQAALAIQLVRLTQQSRRAAVVAERNRLARDIHDTLAQGFMGVIVQLEAAEDAEAQGLREEMSSHLARASELARESLQEARRSVRALRPQVLEQNDLPVAFESLFEKMTVGTGLRTELIIEGQSRRLNFEVAENLLRVVQEALANALRHSSARTFLTRLIYEEESVRLKLKDDGTGFDPGASYEGFGLLGMKERVEAMGGQIQIESAPGTGTSIAIVIPSPDRAPPNGT